MIRWHNSNYVQPLPIEHSLIINERLETVEPGQSQECAYSSIRQFIAVVICS
jgi:hypothetical protein